MSNPIACPVCGDTFWKRISSGFYTAEEFVFTETQDSVTEEDLNTDRMDVTPWRDHEGHEATDEINDLLGELEGA